MGHLSTADREQYEAQLRAMQETLDETRRECDERIARARTSEDMDIQYAAAGSPLGMDFEPEPRGPYHGHPTQLADGSCRVHTCVKCGEFSPGMGRGWEPSPEPSTDEWQALVKAAWQWLSDEYGKSETRLTPWQIRRDVHVQSLARLLRERRTANPLTDEPAVKALIAAAIRVAENYDLELVGLSPIEQQLVEALAPWWPRAHEISNYGLRMAEGKTKP